MQRFIFESLLVGSKYAFFASELGIAEVSTINHNFRDMHTKKWKFKQYIKIYGEMILKNENFVPA